MVSYKHLGLQQDNLLDRARAGHHLYRKGQSRTHFLRCLGVFNPCRKVMQLTSLVWCAGENPQEDRLRCAGSVARMEPDSVVVVAERRC